MADEKKKAVPVIGTLSTMREEEEETGTGHPEMFVLPTAGPSGTQRLDVQLHHPPTSAQRPQTAPTSTAAQPAPASTRTPHQAPPPSARSQQAAPSRASQSLAAAIPVTHAGLDEGDDMATRVVGQETPSSDQRIPIVRPAAGAPPPASSPAMPAAPPASGAIQIAPSTRRKATRKALAIEAVVTTPKGARLVMHTIDASSRGLLVGSTEQAVDVRPGWTCQVLLVHGNLTVDFDAEVVRLVDPSEAPGYVSAFALQVVMLAREQQERLHLVLSHALEEGRARPTSDGPGFSAAGIRLLLMSTLAVLLLGVIGIGGWLAYAARTRVPVTVVSVTRAPLDEVATSLPPGEVIAAQRVTVRSTLVGPKVVRLEVTQGQRVRAGDVLARAHDPSLEDAITKAHARQTAAEAGYRRARDEAAALRNRNVPGADLTQSEGALNGARASMVDARQALDTATAELKRNQIEAPFDGVVAELLIHNGELVEPSAPVCDLVDDTVFRARVNFDETAASRLKVGDPASIWLPGATTPVAAKLEKMGEVVHAGADGHRIVPVEIAFPQNVELRVGASARAEVVLSHKESALSVPAGALVGTGVHRQLFVLTKGDHVESRWVDVGVVQTDLVEVTSGLDDGAKVLVNPPAGLLAGARVEPHEVR